MASQGGVCELLRLSSATQSSAQNHTSGAWTKPPATCSEKTPTLAQSTKHEAGDIQNISGREVVMETRAKQRPP